MGSSGTLFEMHSVVKSFLDVRALDGVSPAMRPGECVDLCGKSGAGESALTKVLSGVCPYGTFKGEILWEDGPLRAHFVRDSERAGIVIIHQELMMVQQLSVAENIFLGNKITKPGGRMGYDVMHAGTEKLLTRLRLTDVNVAAPIMNYGSGHQQLFGVAKAPAKNARLLILDEPTSSLSAKGIGVLLSIIDDLKRSSMACVYISHKLDEIKRVCDTVTIIRDSKHISTRPAADTTIDNIITMMVGREMTSLFPKVEYMVSDVVMKMRDTTCWDVTSPNHKCTDNMSFVVCRGETPGVTGLMSTRCMEMVSTLLSAYPGRSSAEIIMDDKPVKVTSPADAVTTGICLVPGGREHHGVVPLMAVGEGITFATLTRYACGLHVDKGAELTTVGHEIKRLRIKTASPALVIASLSGGNQQKAVVTKTVLAIPKMLIPDEPTRGADVGSKYNIYKVIADLVVSSVAIIMVSSKMPEILGMSNRVLTMGEGQLRGDFVNQGPTQEHILAIAINAEPGRQAA